eukprot:CAMPEP_0170486914 /NCGR_PEP_ID=MMETSP0208-20121228/5824_1 /TAXON_ID=197538 /ORGANISM="Strombidium inclinatum, Strain S3" /LENGTH=61 /DNA_ID=CAMNT_0010761001 /DNA_START=159 /DNA_END=344 /DNA_ORIENTATION=-
MDEEQTEDKIEDMYSLLRQEEVVMKRNLCEIYQLKQDNKDLVERLKSVEGEIASTKSEIGE